MDIIVSQVKEVKGTPRRFEGQHGVTYFFTIEMENGDKGDIAKKSPDAIKPGMELKYTLETNARGFQTIKEFKPNSGRSYGNKAAPAVQSNAALSLSLAVQLAVANIGKATEPIKLENGLGQRVMSIASQFNGWLKENEK